MVACTINYYTPDGEGPSGLFLFLRADVSMAGRQPGLPMKARCDPCRLSSMHGAIHQAARFGGKI